MFAPRHARSVARLVASVALVCGLLASAVARAAAPPEPGWTLATWGLRDGLPVLSFSGLAQDRDGYLWISTFDGLLRFDGATFTAVDASNPSELTSSRFSSVQADPGGGVWVGSEVDGLVHVSAGDVRVVREAGKPLPPGFTAIADRPGEALYATQASMYFVRGDEAKRITDSEDLAPFCRPRRDRHGDVWYLTKQHLVRVRGDRFTTLPLPPGLQPVPRRQQFWWQSAAGDLWFEVDGQVWRIGPNGMDPRPVAPLEPRSHQRERADGKPDLRVVTPDGDVWEARGASVLRNGAEVVACSGEVSALFGDRDGTVWAAASDGLHHIARAVVSVVAARTADRPTKVSVLRQAHDGGVWFGGIDGVLGRWGDDGLRWSPTGRILTGLAETRDGTMYAGTFGGVARVDRAFGLELYTGQGEPKAEVGLLSCDRDGVLWCGARDTLRSGRVGAWKVWLPRDGQPSTAVRSDLHRADGSHWFGTAGQGILVIRGESFEWIGVAQGLPSARVRGLYEDERGVVWAGTEGGGLARIESPPGAPVAKAKVVAIGRRDGLLDDTIHAIVEDDRHRLWVSTNRGIFCVPRERLDAFAKGDRTALSIRAFGEAQGMESRECNGTSQPAALRAADGTLWFASQAGVVVVDPRRVPDGTEARGVTIDGVLARNERVTVKRGVVGLSPRQREFSIRYSSPEFLAPQQLRFRYRLRERGGEWIEAGERRTAYFTDASPGRHTFEVQVSSGGPWSAPATLHVELAPHWWETLAFRLFALLAVIAALWTAYRRRLRALVERERELQVQVAARTADLEREKHATEAARAAAEAERAVAVAARADAEAARVDAESARDLAQRGLETIEQQAEELRLLDAAKSRFFANVSHEFRTPLTLTIGPLEDLLAGVYGDTGDEAREPLELALRNANRALAQVNRILDLARLEAGGMTLQAREGDLARELRDVAALFGPLAVRRGVALAVEVRDGAPAWFDRALLEQAIANLLSNALKFTPAGGRVTLSGGVEGHGDAARWTFAVRDTGPGIAAEEQSRLFERFYQASGARDVSRPGTGIGLSLTRDIVELHGGTITLVSAPGEGSTFTVRLPLGREHLTEAQLAGASGTDARTGPAGTTWLLADAPGLSAPATAGGEAADAEAADAPTVLVVEDDAEVRAYLRRHLDAHYRVIEAGDGREGLDRARSTPPDLVISDVMMPVLDGFAFCEALQADADLAGTPVILLTARASHEDRLAGLSLGAVDYLAKPFHAPELLLRVRNLIAAQHRLRERLRPRALHAAPVEVTSEDDRFLARVRDAIERTMGDETFDLETLAHEVGLSRSQLFRRIKDLLGETPEQLVRRMRLERAAQLLAQRAGSVGEIAYATGFKSVAHFCRVFREQHGATPGQWAERRAQG
ncbi:MAG: two-component regulator propeller domain-containing protein [Candidatus Eisenbacteria bacterium]